LVVVDFVTGAVPEFITSSPGATAACGVVTGVLGVTGLTAATLGTSSPPLSDGRDAAAPWLLLMKAGLGTSSPSVAASDTAMRDCATRVSARTVMASDGTKRTLAADAARRGSVGGAEPAFESRLAQAGAPLKAPITIATKITGRPTRTPGIAGCPPESVLIMTETKY
jgi:hypothetical protein